MTPNVFDKEIILLACPNPTIKRGCFCINYLHGQELSECLVSQWSILLWNNTPMILAA